MNKKRLRKLADLLKRDAKNPQGSKFNLNLWAETTLTDGTVPVSCNTQACAMGLAAISGEFAEDGLDYRIVDVYDSNPVTGRYEVSGGRIKIFFGTEDDTDDGFDAACKLFGIARKTAFWLFQSDNYRDEIKGEKGELTVARRIEAFANGKRKVPENVKWSKW